MPENATELSAAISLRSEELKEEIKKLMDRQEDVQEDILELQRRKRSGQDIDETRLTQLKEVRKEASQMIGLLALERTELLDDLPVIRLATGKLKVVASELEEDAALIDQAAEKLKRATEALERAEKVLVKVISLVGGL